MNNDASFIKCCKRAILSLANIADMRRVVYAVAAMVLASLSPASGLAQPAKTSAPEMLAIDQWIASPTQIQLTNDQQKSVDSIRVVYKKDLDRARSEAKGSGESGSVKIMSILDGRYRKLVRQLLTADQKKIFDANTGSRGDGD